MRQAAKRACRRSPAPVVLLHPESLNDIVVRQDVPRLLTTIYIQRDSLYIQSRLHELIQEPYRDNGFHERPTLEEIDGMIQALAVGYSCAKWVVDAGDRSAREISNEIINRLMLSNEADQ